MARPPIRIFDPRAILEPRLDALTHRFAEFIRSSVYVDGEFVERFEAAAGRRVGLPFAIGTGSGTAALTLALKAAKIGAGDEVVTVANTYYATARAVREAGATPVFVDVDARTAQMDPARVEAAITPRTAAILPVHLYGWPAPSGALREIADRHRIVLVEDGAHAFGGGPPGRGYGHLADFACFSFYPTKALGALGDAGLVATPHRDAADAIRRLRYFADETRTRFEPEGLHAKLDALQAALLLVLLEDYDVLKAARAERARAYQERLQPIAGRLLALTDPDPCPYVFPLRVPDRTAFLEAMRSAGIQAGVHYSVNLHQLEEFGGAPPGSLPATEALNDEIVSLPVHPGVTLDDVSHVCENVLARLT